MHILFNKIFDTGIFPDAWGEGYIVPLHKKGSLGTNILSSHMFGVFCNSHMCFSQR